MNFIKKTPEEESICNKCYNKKRENSKFIDYIGKINDKPWGKEYLAYQNEHIGIWILIVNKDQETSLHCHFARAGFGTKYDNCKFIIFLLNF